jgi:hypothetical protein
MIEAAVNLLPERQWLPGPPLERAGRPPSFTGTNDRETKGDPWPSRRATSHDPVRPTISFGSETIALASFGVS